MVFDYSKLKGKIIEKFGNQNSFCLALGCTPQSLSAKLGGRAKFTQDDIIKIVSLLEIDPMLIGVYFFTVRV